MNLQTLVVLSLVFNMSVNAISSAGIAAGNSQLGYQAFSTNAPAIDLTSIQASSQCAPGSGIFTVICNNILTVSQVFWGTAMTFGVFLWGIINVLPVLLKAILLPGQYLARFGVPQDVINIYNFAVNFLYLMWAYTLWTGRYNAEVT